MNTHNLQVVLKHRYETLPQPDDFAVVKGAIPEPAKEQVLIQTMALSLDPYMGPAIKRRHMSGSINEGDVIVGETVGRIVKSRHPDYAEGDIVLSRGGWQSYSLAGGPGTESAAIPALTNIARKLPSYPGVPPSAYLGVMGMPGLTAYAGLAYLSELKPGQTFVTSAASGAVGSAAGQIAKIMGARVVGIAGSPEKCAATKELFGFDDCVNYKLEGWKDSLKAACPKGIDCYLDATGGAVLQVVLSRLAMGARVLLCGMMDQYNSTGPVPGPNLSAVIGFRAIMKGLVVYDFFDKMVEYRDNAAQWIVQGRLRFKEDVTEGLANAPAAFTRLMAGQNFGKVIIHVSD